MTTAVAEAPSAPPSAPPASPPASIQQVASPVEPAAAAATPPPASDPVTPPPTDDWRARFAGEDTKALETFSRFKTEADLGKAYLEAQKALSKRAEPARLPENAKPEQIAEWRKGLGLPELDRDAKPEAFMEAYKIAIPEGYTPSEVEKGLLGDFAKHAYEKGYSPGEVKGAVDFFLQSQQANMQAANKLNVERQQEWTRALKDDLGRDYEPTIAAAETYLNNLFEDNADAKTEILRAQLPGGGFLGDHPAFVKMVADLALQNGFTDRIEANSMESGGKSLAEQQQELEGLMFKDPAKYNLPATQQKLNKIIELRLNRGEIDESGEPVRKRRGA